MIALDLIASIFSRPSWGAVAPNVRRVTLEQLKYLRDLIAADPEAEKVDWGPAGAIIWTPGGQWRYVLTEDSEGRWHTLARISNIAPGGTGILF